MRVVKNNKNGIDEAVAILKKGGVIVYPTETAYGLGADFLNPKAVKKVYKIKGRKYNKPLSVLVSSLAMAKSYVKFNKVAYNLTKKYWPGPLTLVLPATRYGLRITGNFSEAIGLRISENKLATAIVRKLGRPLTSTSANLSGKGNFYSTHEIEKQFLNKKYQPDLIIDAGNLPKKKVSKVIQILDDKIKVLRK